MMANARDLFAAASTRHVFAVQPAGGWTVHAFLAGSAPAPEGHRWTPIASLPYFGLGPLAADARRRARAFASRVFVPPGAPTPFKPSSTGSLWPAQQRFIQQGQISLIAALEATPVPANDPRRYLDWVDAASRD